jgi:galactokinase
MTDMSKHEEAFRKRFGCVPQIIVRSPGRVEVIGGHTDYNEGFVLPMAIDRQCLVLSARRTDRTVRLFSEHFGQMCEFKLSAGLAPGEPGWGNYAKGVAALLLRAGKELVGLDMLLACDVPLGGGLSSSAAIEVGLARSFLAGADESLDPIDLALLCQEAEHTFADSPCGIMDQFICVLARGGHALLLDCRSQQYDHVPMPLDQAAILIADTRVKHELGRSEYPVRRKQCEQAVEVLQRRLPAITALRDVTLITLEQHKGAFDPLLYARAHHVVTENHRVLETAEAFRANDLSVAGELMSQSHRSCRDDYQISCEELDFLVDEACRCEGVYGARMSGGGFGGCIVALVDRRTCGQVDAKLTEAYRRKYGIAPGIFVTSAAGGAEVIQS